MPYIFVENEVAIKNYHGITIYHLYRNNRGLKTNYQFSMDSNGVLEDEYTFDIREMEGYDPSIPVEMNLTRMIDAGLLGKTDILKRKDGKCDFRMPEEDPDIQPGVCPVCGHYLKDRYWGDSYSSETEKTINQVGRKFTCKCCGASGIEWEELRFNGFEMD